ncbi:hypothetical protein HYPSUDRAFT_207570 [Hypholoma sublateritium FD-334 SS-4]|uniref:Uncharacterized protein n=1 Tax=Hypholoma sublateritium (strain FD-334 SS-4) TaxID=945553 RepID=A0A0D2N9J4_HYPSF|nr:hypothetical protein HYPSUDRAFT_207570 [Hypholoma sublateritium FD-334 SS-4]
MARTRFLQRQRADEKSTAVGSAGIIRRVSPRRRSSPSSALRWRAPRGAHRTPPRRHPHSQPRRPPAGTRRTAACPPPRARRRLHLPPFFVPAGTAPPDEHSARLTAALAGALSRMSALRVLTLPAFEPALLARHSAFGLRALLAWLDGQTNVVALRLPFLADPAPVPAAARSSAHLPVEAEPHVCPRSARAPRQVPSRCSSPRRRSSRASPRCTPRRGVRSSPPPLSPPRITGVAPLPINIFLSLVHNVAPPQFFDLARKPTLSTPYFPKNCYSNSMSFLFYKAVYSALLKSCYLRVSESLKTAAASSHSVNTEERDAANHKRLECHCKSSHAHLNYPPTPLQQGTACHIPPEYRTSPSRLPALPSFLGLVHRSRIHTARVCLKSSRPRVATSVRVYALTPPKITMSRSDSHTSPAIHHTRSPTSLALSAPSPTRLSSIHYSRVASSAHPPHRLPRLSVRVLTHLFRRHVSVRIRSLFVVPCTILLIQNESPSAPRMRYTRHSSSNMQSGGDARIRSVRARAALPAHPAPRVLPATL